MAVRTLWETPFARFQIHSVQLEEGHQIIDDWLWFDECDNVNVLVQSGKEEDEFFVLEQTKYAIDGTTYAVLGGMIEVERDGNDPLTAAKRELREELDMEAGQWTFLGRFVAAANRGGGDTHTCIGPTMPTPSSHHQRPPGIVPTRNYHQESLSRESWNDNISFDFHGKNSWRHL